MSNDISKNKKGGIINDAIIKEIAEAVAALKFGEIVIKIHDSKIIQIEKTEKLRYDAYHVMERGGGI